MLKWKREQEEMNVGRGKAGGADDLGVGRVRKLLGNRKEKREMERAGKGKFTVEGKNH